MTELAKKIAGMGPGLILDLGETSWVVSQAFVVGDDVLVVFPVDADEDYPQVFKFSETRDLGASGVAFHTHTHLRLSLHPLHSQISEDVRKVAEASGGVDQEFADQFVRDEVAA